MDAVGKRQAVTWEDLKYWRYEYGLLRNRLLQDKTPMAGEPAPSSFPGLFPLDENGRLSLGEWQREWTEAFTEVADTLKESRLQENNAIYEIKRYIDQHYMDNLTLQQIAGEFFLAASMCPGASSRCSMRIFRNIWSVSGSVMPSCCSPEGSIE